MTEKSKNNNHDIYRQAYHMMPPKGWMNDPNGLIQYKGMYHMFYQHHPYSPEPGLMHWGHAVSSDLVHWSHLPIALAPGQPYDKNGCFSGSAVDDDGILTLIYSGNIVDEEANVRRQVQCIATSGDGKTFKKFAGNPVIPEHPIDGSHDFRDPKVWKHENTWYAVIGSGKDGIGKALLYKSRDLREWSYVGVLAQSDGTKGRMWECPDFFPLGDKYVLIVSPIGMEGHKNIYMVGEMDYEQGKFVLQCWGDLDCGPHFYAAQTFQDDQGRRILFAWMNMWGAYTPTKSNGWAGAMTLPRILTLSANGKVKSQPAPELKCLRQKHFRFDNVTLEPESANILNDIKGECFEIIAVFEVPAGKTVDFGIKLRCSTDNREETVVGYNAGTQKIYVDTSKSGLSEGSRYESCLEPMEGRLLKIHIFLDRSSIEVFGNEGEVAITSRIYPDPFSVGMGIFTIGGSIKLAALDVWELSSIW